MKHVSVIIFKSLETKLKVKYPLSRGSTSFTQLLRRFRRSGAGGFTSAASTLEPTLAVNEFCWALNASF